MKAWRICYFLHCAAHLNLRSHFCTFGWFPLQYLLTTTIPTTSSLRSTPTSGYDAATGPAIVGRELPSGCYLAVLSVQCKAIPVLRRAHNIDQVVASVLGRDGHAQGADEAVSRAGLGREVAGALVRGLPRPTSLQLRSPANRDQGVQVRSTPLLGVQYLRHGGSRRFLWAKRRRQELYGRRCAVRRAQPERADDHPSQGCRCLDRSRWSGELHGRTCLRVAGRRKLS